MRIHNIARVTGHENKTFAELLDKFTEEEMKFAGPGRGTVIQTIECILSDSALSSVDSQNRWKKIEIADKRVGWVPQNTVEGI